VLLTVVELVEGFHDSGIVTIRFNLGHDKIRAGWGERQHPPVCEPHSGGHPRCPQSALELGPLAGSGPSFVVTVIELKGHSRKTVLTRFVHNLKDRIKLTID
jgi:hypothetical protein